jgi:membrane complex biogenesis BtpA family protein
VSAWVRELAGVEKPLIGMLHAPPLPGSPRYAGTWPAVRDRVLRDAEALVSGGLHALLLENYGDVPFFPGRVPAQTAACLTALAVAVKREFAVPLGINVLRNDGQTALAVALAAEAQFIRVNILCGARLTDQGIVQGIAHDLLRERRQYGADQVRILADVNVKHSAPLASRPPAEEVDDLLTRGGADALIVSGSATGKPVDLDELQQARWLTANRAPLFVGSGVSADDFVALLPHADAFIIGSSFKQEGRAENPVDPQRVRTLMEQFRRAAR